MKAYIVGGILTLALLLGVSEQAKPISCYWDSDCPQAPECCIAGHCRSESSCKVLRAFPAPNYSDCESQIDCDSGCCHNKICSMNDTCNPTSTALPLIIFLVLLALVVAALVSIFIKDRILYKQKKLAARGLSGDGVNKNRERLDTIKKQGGAIRTAEEALNPSTDNTDLEYLSRRNLNQLNEDEQMQKKLNTSRSSSNSSTSRRSRKIHGYGTRFDEEQEEDHITYTSAKDANGNIYGNNQK